MPYIINIPSRSTTESFAVQIREISNCTEVKVWIGGDCKIFAHDGSENSKIIYFNDLPNGITIVRGEVKTSGEWVELQPAAFPAVEKVDPYLILADMKCAHHKGGVAHEL
ncbi:hypothetical protein [Petroclostridium sp. X23]|uniref:hypothetical protein n=1 Tax=Petroclostridium sp. X23 TaxID=3045146 RepID=UPI0024ACBE95|nr:hypothetical protein [Petroclostridium sp. X23]WHH59178.1 hypothetical protein QKW49_25890 [Petroclostridium sp. X23]